MDLTEVHIKNFRCLKDIQISLSNSTVLIGENNAGKTAILDAINITLGRRWGQRGTGFTEYDFHMDDETPNPQTSEGISIKLKFEESAPGEWPEDLKDELNDIIQLDPANDIFSITLVAECGYNNDLQELESDWSFLQRGGSPLTGAARRATNTHKFFQFIPVFSLLALRDTSQEFSSRSGFWGQLLKKVTIPEAQWVAIESELEELNTTLLTADPKLSSIRDKIQSLSSVVSTGVVGEVDIRALPLKIWDLISRSEIFIKGQDCDPHLPLSRHGQGVQSLAVIYLFQAFVDILLEDTYHRLSNPLLLLEEPEAHLHPQGARAMGREFSSIPGQKIATTHSPYFTERVPFRDIRIIRSFRSGAKAFSLDQKFKAEIAPNSDLDSVVNSYDYLAYDITTSELTVYGKLPEAVYRKLLACYTSEADRESFHPVLKDLRLRSKVFITNEELQDLQDWAKRIRGEIFFARVWLLCEGQSDHIIFHAVYEALDFPLDTHGVAVIDYQNNGSPGIFAALARAFGFNWLLTCDGDEGGNGFVNQLRDREFDNDDLENYVRQLNTTDMEEFLVTNGFRDDLIAALSPLSGAINNAVSDGELINFMRQHKTEYAYYFASYLRTSGRPENQFPKYFTDLKTKLMGLANE